MYDENRPTKLTLEQHHSKMSWEGTWDSDLDDIMEGFVGCLRGIGFGDWIIGSIKEWCEDHLPDKENEEA